MKSSNQATPEGEEVDVRTPLKLSLQTFENGSQRRRARRPTRLAIRVAAAVRPLLGRGPMSSMCSGASLAAIVCILSLLCSAGLSELSSNATHAALCPHNINGLFLPDQCTA